MNRYFSIFFKQFNKACVNFLSVWTKSSNCWEILRKFCKFLMKILKKKWSFYFGKFFTKTRAFGNNIVFLQQFFRVRGISAFPPGYALDTNGKGWNLREYLKIFCKISVKYGRTDMITYLVNFKGS